MANITQKDLDQAFIDYKSTYGGVKEDYFSLLYLMKTYNLSHEEASVQIAFGNNDYGVDAFYLDQRKGNLYLFQFKWSENHQLFKESFNRLISNGMERVFGNPFTDPIQNQVLIQLKSCLQENQKIIERVYIYFVFNGDPANAENSKTLEHLREDLEAKKYLIDQFFKREDVTLTIDYLSNITKKKVASLHTKKTHKYELKFSDSIKRETSNGENLYVGFIKIMDLYGMYNQMKFRLFDRNIRYGLSPDNNPNRAIRKSLQEIVLNEKEFEEYFVFNHNGVTISAEHISFADNRVVITEPRILNGAQTITSIAKFIEDNSNNQIFEKNKSRLEKIEVIAKIVIPKNNHLNPDLITNVTINNNRQNPVEPWNLRASDLIQVQLEDRFRDELENGIPYERQENAYEMLTNEDLDEMGYVSQKPIEIKKLAQTFIAVSGDIDKISRLREVFEDDKLYRKYFNEKILRCPVDKIIFLYKIQFRLSAIIRSIQDSGADKLYYYFGKSKNIIWALTIQGLLNDNKINKWIESYGTSLSIETDFSEVIKQIGSTKVKNILTEISKDVKYKDNIEENNYGFLRSKAFFDKCMDLGYEKYNWSKYGL